MAHFARLDENNIVIRVHRLNNDVLMKDGKENEQQGAEFLQNLHKTTDKFIQTSYNGNFRKNYTGKGDTYDQTRDAFISPNIFPSWVLNEDTCRWESPVPYPDSDDEKIYRWDEDTTSWVDDRS
jgi:hypothetical protein